MEIEPELYDLRALEAKEAPSETHALARFLLGKLLVHRSEGGLVGGWIVETEAYPPGDEACHCFRGRTARNAALFLPHGHIYMYRCYGTSLMFNISAEKEGVGAGVLVRALEPALGLDLMRANRGVADVRDLARGPGRLCQALALSLNLNGQRLSRRGRVRLMSGRGDWGAIEASLRIGISKNAGALWRYSFTGNRFVSR
jgi:DNA-3-methyladenine glycosylase